MKNKIYLLFLLFGCVSLSAQTYSWQWAKTGGGTNGSVGTGFSQHFDEQVLDIVIDSNNNTYYLVALFDGNSTLDGQQVTNYGGRDLMLFSTNCQGTIRWSRTIGGYGNGGVTQKIALDNNGGLYLSIRIGSYSSSISSTPVTFGSNNTLPFADGNPFVASDIWRNGFLLKYDTSTGDIVWRKDFQGNVSIENGNMDISPPVIDSQGKINVILGFKYGSHLNGMITVPSTYDSSNPNYQYYLVKYNQDGSIFGSPSLLPLEGETTFLGGYTNFIIDEANGRYYLAGSRNYDGNGPLPLSWNNVPITKTGFILAFSSTSFNELWRREMDPGSNMGGEFIYSIKKDPVTSDIYLGGRFGRVNNQVTFGSDFTFVTPLIGSMGFVMKLGTSNTGSNVQWCTYPTALSDGSITVAVENARMPIALKGNEVLFAKGSIREVWGTFPMVRPTNDGTDPLLVKLNKDTGIVTGTHEVLGNFGPFDQFTAIAVDQDNNVMLGGFIHQQLFVDPNDGVPTISNAAGSSKSNFFYAKLATSNTCTLLGTSELPAQEAELAFYPNPVSDLLQIKTEEKLETYQIYTADGRVVKNGRFKGSDYSIPMHQLATGTYYVTVKGEVLTRTEKIIKK